MRKKLPIISVMTLQVKVPGIYWNYTSNHVLTLEWINGFKLTDTQNIQSVLDPEAIIQIGVTTGLQQLLEMVFSMLILILAIVRYVRWSHGYIDFEHDGSIGGNNKESLVDALVHLVNKDYADLAGDFVRIGLFRQTLILLLLYQH